MAVEDLIEKLKLHAGNNYEVVVSDGNFCTPLQFQIVSGKTLKNTFDISDMLTLTNSKLYFLIRMDN